MSAEKKIADVFGLGAKKCIPCKRCLCIYAILIYLGMPLA